MPVRGYSGCRYRPDRRREAKCPPFHAGKPPQPQMTASAFLTSDRRRTLLAFAALVLGAVAMGASPLFVRLADVGPYASAFWRCALALPFLALWAAYERGGMAAALRGVDRAVILSGVFFAGDLFFWHLSILATTVANATFFATTSPIWVAFGAWLLLGEKIGARTVGGLALCMLGGARADRAILGLRAAPPDRRSVRTDHRDLLRQLSAHDPLRARHARRRATRLRLDRDHDRDPVRHRVCARAAPHPAIGERHAGPARARARVAGRRTGPARGRARHPARDLLLARDFPRSHRRGGAGLGGARRGARARCRCWADC